MLDYVDWCEVVLKRIEQTASESAMRRYKAAGYKQLGKVGMVEILRDPRKLPFSASRPLGKTKQGEQLLKSGQIFVRHGSLIREASSEEFEALRQEAEWAKTH